MVKYIVELIDVLFNKIVVGEVVECFVLVVKELVENVIDVGSIVIDILVEEVGLNKIIIIDNGSGIEEEDVVIVFLCYVISKIKNEVDLFCVYILGFCGEVFLSIVFVFYLEMEIFIGEVKGMIIFLEGGKIIE